MSLQSELLHFQQLTEQKLEALLAEEDSQIAERLHQAMSYSLLDGGKRVRPFLIFACARMLGTKSSAVENAAAAMEMIHTYSLIHDDLPAMDDDNLRRGKATSHIKFDEAEAILAGDSLQSLAYQTLANADIADSIKINWVTTLSQAAGYRGMCGGQSLDLAAENQQLTLAKLEKVHTLKTGALLTACVIMACQSKPDLPTNHQVALESYAKAIGLAFQVQDDILDITATTDELGKPHGSDVSANKSTYPALLGLDGAKQKAHQLLSHALEQLSQLPYNTQLLADFALYIVSRNH